MDLKKEVEVIKLKCLSETDREGRISKLQSEIDHLRCFNNSLSDENKKLTEERDSLKLALQIMIKDFFSLKDVEQPTIPADQLNNVNKNVCVTDKLIDVRKQQIDVAVVGKKKRKKGKKKSTSNVSETQSLKSAEHSLTPPAGEVREATEKRRTVVVLGDSIVKYVQGRKLSRKVNTIIKSFSGARVEDMFHYVKPTVYQHPDEVIIHICRHERLEVSRPKTSG